jgi:hypothetical protein
MNRRAAAVALEMQPLTLEHISEMPGHQWPVEDIQPGAMHVP